MRISRYIIAITASTVAAPVVAQDFGDIPRGAFERAAGNLADRATRSRHSGITAPATVAKPANTADRAPVAGQSEGGIVVAEDMPVISSDGVRVAVVKHTNTGGTTYASDKTFFTADPYYRLRRIYGREATIAGGTVRLKMTAAQYRMRNQNPD